MEALKWVMELMDQVTGPAKNIQKSLSSVTSSLRSVESSASSGLKTLHAGLSVVSMVGSAMESAASSAIGFAKFAVDAAAFKEDTLRSFELMEGSAAAANSVYATIAGLADKTPFKTADILDLFKGLRASGLSQENATDILAAASDVGAVQGSSVEKMKGMIEGVMKIRGKDALSMETLEPIITSGAGAGVNMGAVLEAIASARHVTLDQARALISAGKIKGNEGISAILDVVQSKTNKGGALGAATKLFGQESWAGQVSTFESRLSRLFEDVKIGPLKTVLTTINTLLDSSSESGKRVQALFNGMFGDLGGWLSSIATPENLSKLLEVMGTVGVAIWDVVKAVKDGFGGGLKSILAPLMTVIHLSDGVTGNGRMFATVFHGIGTILGWAAGIVVYAGIGIAALGYALVWVVDQLMSAPKVLGELWDLIADTVSGWAKMAWNWGSDLIGGLWQGIKDAWGTLKAGWNDLIGGLPKAVADKLTMHSPSQVMADLGKNVSLGFAQGINDNAWAVGDAVAGLSVGSLTVGGGGAGGLAGGRGGGGNVFNINVQVSDSGDPRATADVVLDRLREDLEGIALQLGVA